MRRTVSGALMAVLAAGAMVAALGSAPTAAAAPRSAGPVIYTTDRAGYQAGGGRYFRFATTTLTIPPAGSNTSAYVSLRSATQPGVYVTLGVRAGAHRFGGVWFDFGHFTSCPCWVDMRPLVGDRLSINVFYDQQTRYVIVTVNNLTRHTTHQVWGGAGKAVYDYAEVGAMVTPAGALATPAGEQRVPQVSLRLWQLTGSLVTTYSGDRGALLGPWVTSQLIETSNGGRSGTVLMSPSSLWDSGHDFGVWQR